MTEKKLEKLISIYIDYYINSLKLEKDIKLCLIKNIRKISDNMYEYNEKNMNGEYSIREFLEDTSKLDEVTERRKSMGAYYTPEDVSNFIALNMILLDYNNENKLFCYNDFLNNNLFDNKKIQKNVLKKSVIDPTCGNSEFLISVIKCKIKLLKRECEEEDIYKICNNLYGNDINEKAIIISKIRIFIMLISQLDTKKWNKGLLNNLSIELNNNFTNKNILIEELDKKDFDFVIGNPPFIESSRYPIKLDKKYGNIYANILEKGLDILKNGGYLSFIVPISYTSTPRMKKIRKYINNNSSKQVILNFADRPDALFSSAHQKLSILFIKKCDEENLHVEDSRIYTSNYKYWYKEERKDLFKDLNIIKNSFPQEEFIPKLGNTMDIKIYNKIKASKGDSIYENIREKDLEESGEVYLNMRATFWIKVFLDNGMSNEYKKISSSIKNKYYLYCLFNSSLFFWYWTVVSDCWHITNKEFKNFRMINNIEKSLYEEMERLAYMLEDELERTKVYVGTKQTDYEYKHRDCKMIIDEIDGLMAKIYGLNEDELDYIINFAIRYRESRGPKNESN